MWALSTTTLVLDSGWFFAVQASWSLAIIHIVRSIEISRLTLSIIVIEVVALLLHLMAYSGYVTSYEFFYENYTVILATLNTSEIAVLIMGAPRDGILRLFSSLRASIASSGSSVSGYIRGLKGIQGQA